jgi:CRISPR-associated exonuclease Cas4
LSHILVTDLKQWAYCQRVVYYRHMMPGVGKSTFKMKEAVAAQDLIESLEVRRGLGAYGFEGARRQFNVWLSSERLGLSGKLDLALVDVDRVAVVDFKLTAGEVGENHRLQLAGYSLLAEEKWGASAGVGFLYRIPDNRVFPVEITAERREMVVEAVRLIGVMADGGELPAPTEDRGKCRECEYANYCADIW